MQISEMETQAKRQYEIVEYMENLPFRIQNIKYSSMQDGLGNTINVLEHWHQEIEIVYTVEGCAKHYIDGMVHKAYPGSVFVTNSESIHKVVTDNVTDYSSDVMAIVVTINYDFIEKLIPNMKEMYFLSEVKINRTEIEEIITVFSYYADEANQFEKYEFIHLMGLLYKLIYLLCKKALCLKEEILPVNNQKNLERLRGIMQFVSENYTDPIAQHEVAKKFYFTKEYFSRFFRKNTGMTFKEYLTRYRVNIARDEILHTQKSILEIALDCGFSDARGLINAFKGVYGITPLKYRKMREEE